MVSPAQLSGRVTLAGTTIWGTQQTRSLVKKVSMFPEGVTPVGAVAEAHAE